MLFFGIELPLDLTLLSALAVFAMVVFRLYRGNKLVTREISFYGIGLLIVFYVWLVFSSFYSSSDSYARDKIFYFFLNVAAFSVTFLYHGFDYRKFVKAFTVITILLVLAFIPFLFFMGRIYETDSFDRFASISGMYLTLSEFLGLICIVYLTANESILKTKTRDRILVVAAILFLLLLGARGPILFVAFIYGLFWIYKLRAVRLAIKTRTALYLVLGLVIVSGTLVIMFRFQATQELLARTSTRFMNLVMGVFSGEYQDRSSMVRLELYQDAIQGIFAGLPESFFGYGIGSFGVETIGKDVRLYPHNMILEIWFELGFVGLILFAGWLIFLLSKTLRLPYRFISYWLLMYFFLNLMKSSSLVDIRTEFAFLGAYVSQHFELNNEDSAHS